MFEHDHSCLYITIYVYGCTKRLPPRMGQDATLPLGLLEPPLAGMLGSSSFQRPPAWRTHGEVFWPPDTCADLKHDPHPVAERPSTAVLLVMHRCHPPATKAWGELTPRHVCPGGVPSTKCAREKRGVPIPPAHAAAAPLPPHQWGSVDRPLKLPPAH